MVFLAESSFGSFMYELGQVLLRLIPIGIAVGFYFYVTKSKKEENKDLRQYKIVFFSCAVLTVLLLSSYTINYDFVYNTSEDDLVAQKKKPQPTKVLVPPTRIKDPIKPKPKVKPKVKTVEFVEEEVKKIIDEVPDLPPPDEDLNNDPVTDDIGDGDPDFSGEIDDDPVWIVTDEASFPGGQAAMFAYFQEEIEKRLRKNPRLKSRLIGGKINVKFVIEKDGTISSVELLNGLPNKEQNDLAQGVVESMPTWKPGKNNGFEVRLYKIVPIKFNVK